MDDLILRLGIALSIGLLVGLERGWRERNEPDGSRAAGIRTFAIAGLLGGVLAALAQSLAAPAVLIGGFLGFAALFGWFEAEQARHEGRFSVTSVVAGLCVFALGALAVTGDERAAAAGGAALAALLSSREILHDTLRRLTWIELRSAVVLAVMTMVVLPLLPDRSFDPWGGFNPWEIWFFTALTAGISYMGYVAVRLLGPARGILVSALAGAVVSSMAVTVAFARQARAGGDARHLAGAAAAAAMVSILRVTLVVGLLQPGVLPQIAAAAVATAALFGLSGLVLLGGRHRQTQSANVAQNPFELTPLLIFAAIFATVSTASAALVSQFGSASLVVTSALSGSFDTDVAVLSALRMVDKGLALPVVGVAVLSAITANALGRLTMAMISGPVGYWLPLALTTLLALAGGGAVLWALPPL